MDKKTIKTLGIWGFIIYLLSLPILIWKSSRAGRRVSLVLMLLIILFFSGKFFYKGLEFYKESRYTEFEINQHEEVVAFYKEIQEHFAQIKKAANQTMDNIKGVDARIEKHIDAVVDKSIGNITAHLEEMLPEDELKQSLEEIEKAIQLVKDEEKQALKLKIIEIREMVKIHKKSIDSVEIRELCEEAVEYLYLFNDEERQRMYRDLNEVGFSIERVSEDVVNIVAYSENAMRRGEYERSYFVATSDSVMPFYGRW